MKTKFKVTSRTTKADLLEVLTANAQNTEGVDQQTVDTAAYAIKNPGKATRSDLTTLVKTFMTALGDKFIVPTFAEKPKVTAENLLKKSSPEAKADDKTGSSKKPSKGDDDNTKKKAAKKPNPMVAQASDFPDTIDIGGKTFNIVHGNLTMEELNREDVEYEFCFWWTKRHLKQFPYFQGLPHPDEFQNDLDCTQLIYVSDEGKVAYTVSDVTEASYVILPQDLEEIDGVRVAGNIEYAIYSAPAGDTTEETDEDDEETAEESSEDTTDTDTDEDDPEDDEGDDDTENDEENE